MEVFWKPDGSCGTSVEAMEAPYLAGTGASTVGRESESMMMMTEVTRQSLIWFAAGDRDRDRGVEVAKRSAPQLPVVMRLGIRAPQKWRQG